MVLQTSAPFDENTIAGTARNRAKQFADKVFLLSRYDSSGTRTDSIHPLKWGEFSEIGDTLARGLHELGVEAGDRVGIFGPNTPRWILASYSVLGLRGTFVPIYPSSSTDDAGWCFGDSGAKVVFCQSREQVEKVLAVADKLSDLSWIVVMGNENTFADRRVLTFEEVLQQGQNSAFGEGDLEQLTRGAEEDDIASIIYTSGTTGRPKGVMLTNRNFISQRSVLRDFEFSPDDVWLAHLPLCHALGFSADFLNAAFHGGTLFVADSVETEEMRWNLQQCRPTVMTSVPRLWEKLYLQIGSIVGQKPQFVQNLVKWSLEVGKRRFQSEVENSKMPAGIRLKSKLAGRIFRKVRRQAGIERLRICITGGGPIQADLIEFFGAIGVNIYQGYGLTETSPVTHASTPRANKIGYIGRPIPYTVCTIAPDGELLIRGPQVMKGYWNNARATAEAFTEDGYFMTGDIARVDEDGFYCITDRKKELIITSGGKNIAPQPIQNAFNIDPYIEQVYVTGDRRKYIAALVVPNFDELARYAKEKGISWSSRGELIGNEQIKSLIGERIELANRKLSKPETIKKFAILENEFSEEGGELTATLKLKRRVIEQKYKEMIDSLYPTEQVNL